MRWPVHFLCFTLMLGLGYLLYYFSGHVVDLFKSWRQAPNQTIAGELTYVVLRQIAIAASFGSVAVFYMRWLNRWFESHSAAEFALKQYQLDVDRASWLVEAAMEWNSQVKEQMPSALLDRISRNLFASDSSERSQMLHPTDALASVLGNASKIKLNAGPAEIEISGKDLKKSKPVPTAD